MVASSQRFGIAPVTTARVVARLAALALLLGSLLAFAPAASAQNRATATLYLRVDGDDVKAAIEIAIDPGYHLGHGPTDADVGGPESIGAPTTLDLAGDGFDWSDPRFPEPEREAQVFGATKTWLWVHHGTPVVWLRGRKSDPAADPAAIRITLKGQTCNESGCVQYKQIVSEAGRGSDELFAKFPADLTVDGAAGAGQGAGEEPEAAVGTGEGAASGAPAAAGNAPANMAAGGRVGSADAGGGQGGAAPIDGAAGGAPQLGSGIDPASLRGMSLWTFLYTAVAFGLIALFMPCTYPMIPITVSYFTKQATARQTGTTRLALVYGFGIVAIYTLIGLVFGELIIPFAFHWVTNLVFGAMFVLFGLSMIGVFLLQAPQFLTRISTKATRAGGYGGVFLMGATLVVTSFTCTGPFVGSLLAIGADGSGHTDRGRVALGMAIFGLTMAVPFVALAMVPGKVKQLPKSGGWMHTFKVVLGFIEIAAALKFFSNVDVGLQAQVFPRELFLLLVGGCFFLAAAYLFGWLRLDDEAHDVALEPGAMVKLHPSVSAKRLSIGVALFLFAVYCVYGSLGNRMDRLMTSLVPPYSGRIAGAGEGEATGAVKKPAERTIVKDDLDVACEMAIARGKLVLVNFTGFQ